MLLAIYDNDGLIEHRECRAVRLPTGLPGAVWRGLAYPLGDAGAIQIDGLAYSPALCAEGLSEEASPPPRAPASWALIDGIDEAYVVLQGSVIEVESAAGRLKDAGFNVRRHGRYLGDSIDGLTADWFIRFVKPNSKDDLRYLLERALGGDRLSSLQRTDDALEMRCRLLAAELEAAKAEKALLHDKLSRLTVKLAEVEGHSKTEIDLLLDAIEDERRQREIAEASAATVVTPAPADVPRRAAQSGKLKDEVASVIKALLPRIELIHDTMTFVTMEMQTRSHLYRALSELNTTREGMPSSWKKLQGIQKWWERHVSTGQDDAGRIYARLDQMTNHWLVLVSHKGDQSRDIDWLVRNS
jgi:hypothetical protein